MPALPSNRPQRSARASLALVAALAGLPLPAAAQYDTPPGPAAYALAGVTLVAADGSVREGMTLVVRRGLIETLAADADIPGDARRLEGEGLYLYPGFVDGQGEAGVDWPDARDVEDPDDVTSWDPPRSRQGFRPHRRVADFLDVGADDLDDLRSAGVVAAHVLPDGGMAPGRSALLVLRDGRTPWDVVERASAGLVLSFQTAGGVYPSQLFGVIAYLRQAFLDAERWERMRTAAEGGEGGFVPPGWDPDYEALRTAARGEEPVYFEADSDEDIRRALDLADQFGFRIALVGGAEAWKLADELADRGVPVFVSLDFPVLSDWDPEADTVPAELDPAAAREKEEVEAIWSNAARLRAAGVQVALTSGGGDADLLEGMRKVVEYGLPPEEALRALTTTPATLLGVPGITRIEAGRPATFVVATGPLVQEETQVRYTFVEGHLTEVDVGGGGSSGEAPAGDLSGSWSGTISAGGQEMDLSLTLTQSEDGSLQGQATAAGQTPSPVRGTISGTSVTLRIEAEDLPEPIVLNGTLSDDGDAVSGSGSTPFGEMTFRVQRSGGDAWRRLMGGAR